MVCYQIILILLSLMILIYLHVQLYTCTCKCTCTCVHVIWEILLSIDVFINLYQKIQLVLKPPSLSVYTSQYTNSMYMYSFYFIRALNGWALFVGIFFLNVRNCSYNPVWRSHPNGEELLGCVWSRKPFLSFQYVG